MAMLLTLSNQKVHFHCLRLIATLPMEMGLKMNNRSV